MKHVRSLFLILLLPAMVPAQGSVYLVLGSDTGIWEGLNVDTYVCTYGLGLYDDPARNAYKVMDPAFRAQFKDSYGTPMKMTWWMMGGNTFRFATNRNVPVPNIMPLYLMKKYHGAKAALIGDEITFHYHTWTWTDYDNDGKYYWNQAKNFTECREDFDVTVAQFLLEENVFPVSFRSGWHAMDNEWQNYLDSLIPYSLHDDYPAKKLSDPEPIDNIFDWSRSSKEYVPFHPSLADYQVPGNGKSWNTRSIYMARLRQADMDSIFKKAADGVDQVPCLWAHLPEGDFPQNMKRIDSLAHVSAAKYPAVKFSYCTAVEAMQKWRKGTDTIPPEIAFSEVITGNQSAFTVQTSEDIFQSEPFVAVKDINDRYVVLHCAKTADNQWTTTESYTRTLIAKAGVAVTDTMGNLATAFLNILPDPIYIDNLEPQYQELSGAWTTKSAAAWGTDSRQCILGADDTARAEWTPSISQSRLYSVFMQVPKIQNQAGSMEFKIFSDGQLLDSVEVNGPFAENDWTYITTTHLQKKSATVIQMTAYGNEQTGKIAVADGMLLTGIVKERQIYTKEKMIRPEAISEEDSIYYPLRIENRGINDLTINNISSTHNFVGIGAAFPSIITGMKNISTPLLFYSAVAGEFRDTLVISSNDPNTPEYAIPVLVAVEPYFRIVDNEDSLYYSESGPWAKSVAQEWGPTSRYAYSGQGASATFTVQVKKNGHYEIFEIVPTTVNAIANAHYYIYAGTDTLGRMIIDQNKGSGAWVSLGTYSLTTAAPTNVTVADKGPATSSVVRADAVKFQILSSTYSRHDEGGTPSIYSLDQNFPNPFNPSTSIRFSLPEQSAVTLTVYDMLGREISTVVNDVLRGGLHTVQFDGSRFSSGMYVYRIRAGAFMQSKVMVLLK